MLPGGRALGSALLVVKSGGKEVSHIEKNSDVYKITRSAEIVFLAAARGAIRSCAFRGVRVTWRVESGVSPRGPPAAARTPPSPTPRGKAKGRSGTQKTNRDRVL